MTMSPASITAPPISDASTAVVTSTSRPKRLRRDSLSLASVAASSGWAEVTVALTRRSASARSCSNRPEISGSSGRRRLPASSTRNQRKVGSLSPGGSSRSTSASALASGWRRRVVGLRHRGRGGGEADHLRPLRRTTAFLRPARTRRGRRDGRG